LTENRNYNVTVEIIDNATNKLNSSKRPSSTFTVWFDSVAPTNLSIDTPQTNGMWVKTDYAGINGSDATMERAGYALNWTTYINGTLNNSGTNITSKTGTDAVMTGLLEGGFYNLTLEVVDYSNLHTNTSRRFFYDATNGSVNLTTLNTTLANFTNGAFRFKAADGARQNLNYTIYVNGTLNTTGTNATNSALFNAGFDATDGQAYYIIVEIKDNASNAINSTNNTVFFDSTKPENISILVPATNNVIASDYITINGSDATMITAGHSLNVTILVNGTVNITISNLTSKTATSVALSGLQENGYYNVTARFIDYAGNFNESTRLYFFDGTGPTISSTTSGANNSRLITFRVNDTVRVNTSSIVITQQNASFTNFNFSRDCVANAGQTDVNCTYIETGVTFGDNQLNIDAKDNASNSAPTFQLNITVPTSNNFTVSLTNGWNLISTPLILFNDSIDNIVANESNIIRIYNFDGTSFSSWNQNLTDTLTTMVPMQGYWVFTNATSNLYLFGNLTTGTPPVSYGVSNPRSLTASRWYLAGYYSTAFNNNRNTDDALAGLCSGGLCSAGFANFESLLWYDTANSLLNSTVQSSWDEDAIWDKGRGFWIYIRTADTLTGTP